MKRVVIFPTIIYYFGDNMLHIRVFDSYFHLKHLMLLVIFMASYYMII